MSLTEGTNLEVSVDRAANDEEIWPGMVTPYSSHDTAQVNYQRARVSHWNESARRFESWTGLGGYYHRRLTEIYRFFVSPGQTVLELGCGRGDLLAALKPALGVGVDF